MSFINDVAYYLYITGPIISALLTFSNNKIIWSIRSCSVAQLCPTLQPHRLQQARFPCPSPGLPHCRWILLSAEPPLEGADAEVEAPKLWPPDVKS